MRSDIQGSVVQCLQIRLEDPLLGESALRQGRSSGGGLHGVDLRWPLFPF